MNWSEELLTTLKAATSADFSAFLIELSSQGEYPHWEHSLLPEEKGLEIWLQAIANHGQMAYVTAAAAAARYAYPIVMNKIGEEAMEYGFHEDAESMDGESEGMKIRRVEAWLQNPTKANLQLVQKSIDPSRQLEVWEEDLNPGDNDMWWWFMTVGQLCAEAVTHSETDGDDDAENSYYWTAPTCAIRGVLTALKSMRRDTPDADVSADVVAIGKAIAAAFGVKLF